MYSTNYECSKSLWMRTIVDFNNNIYLSVDEIFVRRDQKISMLAPSDFFNSNKKQKKKTKEKQMKLIWPTRAFDGMHISVSNPIASRVILTSHCVAI